MYQPTSPVRSTDAIPSPPPLVRQRGYSTIIHSSAPRDLSAIRDLSVHRDSTDPYFNSYIDNSSMWDWMDTITNNTLIEQINHNIINIENIAVAEPVAAPVAESVAIDIYGSSPMVEEHYDATIGRSYPNCLDIHGTVDRVAITVADGIVEPYRSSDDWWPSSHV